ncbi:hypothetical protein [Bdellovibrio sp.]|uniref:hypothetical protein n=1 Tax=Bdellovibrio sp. TaxID=28201 RepID=UPI003221ABFC
MKNGILLLTVLLAMQSLPTESFAMSKALNFFSALSSNITGLFGRAIGSSSPCTDCAAQYRGPKPPAGSGLPVWSEHPDGEKWTQYTVEAIEKEGLANLNPKDAPYYCPNWNNLTLAQRKNFWLNMVSKMAELESVLNPSMVHHDKGNAAGLESNGLLAMSTTQCSYLKTRADTLNPKKNLHCGVHTIKYWLVKTNAIGGHDGLTGIGNNWQIFVPNPIHDKEWTRASQNAVMKHMRALPYCKITGVIE